MTGHINRWLFYRGSANLPNLKPFDGVLANPLVLDMTADGVVGAHKERGASVYEKELMHLHRQGRARAEHASDVAHLKATGASDEVVADLPEPREHLRHGLLALALKQRHRHPPCGLELTVMPKSGYFFGSTGV